MYRPKSIGQDGLRKWLDDSAHLHNGNGYSEFIAAIDTANQHKLAEKFNVKRHTIMRWIRVYKEEEAKESTNAN